MSKTILSTKMLTSSQKAILTAANITVVEYDAINIELLSPDIKTDFKNIIFTSQNTVKAFLEIIGPQNAQKNSYRAYCVGEKTKSLLGINGINVVETAHYGAELAKILVENYPNVTFLFLCGDKRRHEIPSYLKQHKVAFKEHTVYKNTPYHHTFATDFDGIMFFSPSGIESFIARNNLRNSIAFCIGTTTAAEAQKHTKNIVVAHKPTIESVLDKVAESFKTKIN